MPAVNEIYAPLGNRMEATTATVYQYNSGMMLRPTGPELPENYRVDFANSVSGQSKSMFGGVDGVLIPYEYFVPGSYIHAWIVLVGEDYAVTRYHITIPISPRAVPTEEQPSQEQENIIDQTIAALNDGVERAETAADNAEQAVANVQETVDAALQEAKDSGEFNGADGVSPTATVTQTSTGATITVTDAQGTTTAEISNGQDGEPGTPGAPGTDGVSPTVTVTDIEGGHRITITDADGPHSFDVMDGSSADGSVFIAEYGVTTYSDLLAAFNAGKVLVCKYTKSRQTIYSALYSYQSNDGFRFSVYGKDSVLRTYWFLCRSGTGWVMDSAPYNAITDLGSVESGDYLVFADANGLNRLTRSNNLKFGADSDKYLANDGTWQDVPDSPVQDVQVNGTSVVVDGVANVPIANKNQLGAVKVDHYGVTISNGFLFIQGASGNDVKNGNNQYGAITSNQCDASAFYGLAKAAGDITQKALPYAVGNYTDSAKSAISQMLNSPVTVSGTTPTITALPGVRYVCGEVATLDITLPASGCVDITFESGSTPTVLTITPPSGVTLKWANGFDPTALEADTTYEINIADGLGVAASWT